MTLASLLIALLGDDTAAALRYERAPILAGEVWRLFTGHLVHLSWSHLWLNLGGLALIWFLFRRQLGAGMWWLVLLVSSLAVSSGFLLFDPALEWYVGLSGVLHGLFMAGLIVGLRTGAWSDWLLLSAVVAKLIWEQLYGALPGSTEAAGGNVIVDAHLYGAIGGAAVALALRLYRRGKYGERVNN
ncbi:MAG: rhombosortase [Pseudomonadota bacterium]